MRSVFSKIGLSPKEERCYTYLLEHGEQTAARISKDTGIARTNMYHILGSLQDRHLIDAVEGSGKTLYSATHPEALENLLEKQEAEIKETRRLLQAELPRMAMNFALLDNKSGVYRFEGIQGLVRVYDELVRDKLTVNSLMSRELLRKVIADYNPQYIKKRVRNKIRSRVIAVDAERIATPDAWELREIRYLDPKKLPFQMDFKVTAKKIVLTTLSEGEIVGIILNDPGVVKNFGHLFEFLWETASP